MSYTYYILSVTKVSHPPGAVARLRNGQAIGLFDGQAILHALAALGGQHLNHGSWAVDLEVNIA